MKNNEGLWILGHKLKAHQTTGNFDMVAFETPPRAQGPPPHIHSTYEEAFLILEGELEFIIDGKPIICKAGESIDVPPGTLHTFNNRSDQACKWVNIHSPKGFYGFFEKFGIPENEENALSKSLNPRIIEEVLKTATDFDMAIPAPSEA